MRVLIMSKYFPPSNLIAAQRPWSWYIHLPLRGLESIVITSTALTEPLPRVFEVSERKDHERSKLISKFLSFQEMWIPFFLPHFSRLYPIYLRSDKYIQQHKVDIIIATGEPFILHKFAAILSKKHKVPWIADYRDNWSNEPTSRSFIQNFFSKTVYSFVEKRLLKSATCITTVASPTAARVNEVWKDAQVHLIPNGHLIPDNLIPSHLPKSHLEVAYFGRLYEHRNPYLFIASIRKWKTKNPEKSIKLIFYGLEDFPAQVSRVKNMIVGIENSVFFTKSLPYSEMLRRGSAAHCFLMLADKKLPLTNGKMYDYLGLGRPILLVPDDESIFSTLITQLKCGFSAKNVEDTMVLLDKLYSELGNETFFKTAVIRKVYSRESSTRKLGNLIRELCVE